MEEVNGVVEMATNGVGDVSLIVVLVMVLVATVFVVENLKKFKEIFGIKDKWTIREEQQNQKIKDLKVDIEQIGSELKDLRLFYKEGKEKRLVFENETIKALKDIQNEILQNKIDVLRESILEFGVNCQTKEYNKESYDNVLRNYDLYEEALQKAGLTNGRTEMAIQYIRKRYAEYMEKGFPQY